MKIITPQRVAAIGQTNDGKGARRWRAALARARRDRCWRAGSIK
jgi:hypothetical protein